MSASARTGDNPTPFLRTSNVLWDEIDLGEVDEMSMSPDELSAKSLLPGDLLVCEGGEIGRSAVWAGGRQPMSFQNHLHRLRPLSAEVEPKYYVYFLQSAFTQLGLFEGAGNKTTIPNLSRNRLLSLEVPNPSLNEQLAIATLLAEVRHALRVETSTVTAAKQLKQATMRELFTRGLRAEALKESEIGPIPKGWSAVSLGDLGRIGNGSTPKRGNPAYWSGGTFPWLNSAKVYDREILSADQFVTPAALEACHLPKLKPGAVLVAITGQGKTLGHCAVLRIEATINQHVAYLDTNRERADPSFVRGYLETQYAYLRQIAAGGGSTKGALTCAFLRGLKLPLPCPDSPAESLQEQREIASVLDAIDQKIDVHQKKQVVLEALFKSLLHKLMTGEVRVSDLDLSALNEPTPVAEAVNTGGGA